MEMSIEIGWFALLVVVAGAASLGFVIPEAIRIYKESFGE